mgnify:CR=1 FL=1
MKMDQEAITKVIPHRDPMLLVNTVEELTPGEESTAPFYVDQSLATLNGPCPV